MYCIDTAKAMARLSLVRIDLKHSGPNDIARRVDVLQSPSPKDYAFFMDVGHNVETMIGKSQLAKKGKCDVLSLTAINRRKS